jgi:phage terminase large subunit-like protein
MTDALSLDSANAELARRSLLAFGRRVEPAFTPARHVTYLCGLLEDLERGEKFKRLCVSMPPRFAKTTTCSQLYPAWMLGRDSRREIILANHSAELAGGFSRKAKGYIESPLWPFHKIELAADSRAVSRWHVGDGGGLHALGVGSGITGIGADLLIIDDPVNDALSETERSLAWEWYRQVAFPRCNSDARVLVVSARLAVDDLPGLLAEADDASEWKFVSLPATNSEGNELNLPAGEPLWPEKFGHDELRQRREAMGLAAYEAQYQQRPSVAGGGKLFRLSDFPTWERLPRPTAPPFEPLDLIYDDPLKRARADNDSFLKVTGCDFAGVDNTSTGGSYSAFVTVLYDAISGNLYVTDCERHRNVTREALTSLIWNHLARNGPDLVIVEEAASGGYFGGMLSRTQHRPIKLVQPKTSKSTRALQIIGMVEGHKIHLPMRSTWGDMLRAEIAEYPGRYTDMVDSLVWACLYCRQLAAARREDRFYEEQLEGFSLFG